MTTAPDPTFEQETARLRAATLGDFEILGELGRGGMAVVYLAHDIALDRKVALKLISPSIASSAEAVARFKREARTAASLSHPNIIPIYTVRETDGLVFFVMKLIDGRPLDDIMREIGPLPLPMIQAILSQVAGAFGHAHRAGVVHRDIKPGNIIIDNEGWCVVTDFGIAKVAASDGLTTTGTMVGTPTYMAPEQCLGYEITGASDQYALGVVAYEMITGKVPYGGTTMMSVMYAHVNTPPPPIETLRDDCPDELNDAVMRMLEKDPADRFGSIEEAVAAIAPETRQIDDPTRSQLITLAKSGMARLPGPMMSTPRSPLPRARTPSPEPAVSMATPAPNGVPVAPHRSPVVAIGLVAAAAIIAAAIYFRPNTAHPVAADSTTIASSATTAPIATPAAPAAPTPNTATTTTAPVAVPVASANAARPTKGAAAPAAPATAAPVAVAPPTPAPPPEGVLSIESSGSTSGAAPAAPTGASVFGVQTAAPSGVAPAARAGIERAIRAYGHGLVTGEVAELRRVYPAMPDARRAQYETGFPSGLRHTVRWQIGAITVDGKRATAKLTGSTSELHAGAAPYTRPVDEEVLLERAGNDSWIITRTAQ